MRVPDVFTPMTRFDVENEYYVSCSGEILSRGRFYQCPAYVPYIWSDVVRGEYTRTVRRDKLDWAFTRITAKHREEFPELLGIREVGLCQQGNQVLHWVVTERCAAIT